MAGERESAMSATALARAWLGRRIFCLATDPPSCVGGYERSRILIVALNLNRFRLPSALTKMICLHVCSLFTMLVTFCQR